MSSLAIFSKLKSTSTFQQLRIIIPPSFLWFFAGFDLILLPLFSAELGRAYFPSDNPVNSILAVYGTFSLSLFMRVFGGIYFGRLSDRYGRKRIIMISSWFLTIIMIISAYVPSDYTYTKDVIYPTISFVITRVLIGFFVGGLWPTAAVLAMENLHCKKFKEDNKKKKDIIQNAEKWKQWKEGWKGWNNDFENKVKRLIFQSSILQVWFFLGYFVSALLLISYGHYLANGMVQILSSVPNFFSSFVGQKALNINNILTPLPQYYDFPLWRSMSLIAGFIGLVLSFLCRLMMDESTEWKEWNEGWKKWREEKKQTSAELYRPGIITLLENKKYREILFSFWLIMTGLMYMYYSTIVTAPELFLRDGIAEVSTHNTHILNLQWVRENFFVFLLLMMTLAHVWVGILCHIIWNRLDRSGSEKSRWKSFFSLNIILSLKNKTRDLFLRLIESDHKHNDNDKNNDNNKDLWKLDDLDVRSIINLGFVLIPIGIVGSILFAILQPGNNNNGFYAVAFTSIVILVANAAWAFIPSMLSSRFPIHLRATGASLAYNGGLVIGFASPFIIIEFYLNFKSESVIFVAMILGAISMIVGGLRLMHMINKKEKQHQLKPAGDTPHISIQKENTTKQPVKEPLFEHHQTTESPGNENSGIFRWLPKIKMWQTPKKPLNKWVVILPVIVVGIIGVVVTVKGACCSPLPPPQFLKYQNPAYVVTMQYPYNWIKNETKGNVFVTFDSLRAERGHYIAEVRLGIVNNSPANLTELLNYNTRYFGAWPNFRLIDSNTTSRLADRPAYKLVFTSSTGNSDYKIVDTGTVVDSKQYYIEAIIVADQYSNYFPTVQQMIKSFTITPTPQ